MRLSKSLHDNTNSHIVRKADNRITNFNTYTDTHNLMDLVECWSWSVVETGYVNFYMNTMNPRYRFSVHHIVKSIIVSIYISININYKMFSSFKGKIPSIHEFHSINLIETNLQSYLELFISFIQSMNWIRKMCVCSSGKFRVFCYFINIFRFCLWMITPNRDP